MFTLKENKETATAFRSALVNVWGKDGNMIEYCYKKTDLLAPLADGDFVAIDKPTIEKHFCYGYGFCGVSTEEDYNDAARMANKARTDRAYFVRENLKNINTTIAGLLDDQYTAYKYTAYGKAESPLKNYTIVQSWKNPENDIYLRNLPGVKVMTDAERKTLAAAYTEEKDRFTKRLETYLKKYGLSKIHSWAYLSD